MCLKIKNNIFMNHLKNIYIRIILNDHSLPQKFDI